MVAALLNHERLMLGRISIFDKRILHSEVYISKPALLFWISSSSKLILVLKLFYLEINSYLENKDMVTFELSFLGKLILSKLLLLEIYSCLKTDGFKN